MGWDSNPTPTGSIATAIGTGSANTTKILAVLVKNGHAALQCSNYRGGGYADWFLPSKGELIELYKSRRLVGNLTYDLWSSSEGVGSLTNRAWTLSFRDGIPNLNYKSDGFGVRAVRAF